MLARVDEDLAAEADARGLPCGGAPAPSGLPPEVPRRAGESGPAYHRRYSFCCDRDGCRRRATGASLRFLGRRVHLGVVLVLVSIPAHELTLSRLPKLRGVLGASLISVRTIGRRCAWWRAAFLRSPFWQHARRRLSPSVEPARRPAALLARFQAPTLWGRIQRVLAFLGPLTIAGAASLGPVRPHRGP